jgi:hypothetical protein
MLNPWADLPDDAPFIARVDADYIRRYPQPYSNLELELLPPPYLGKPDARVYFLLRSPSAGHDDRKYPGFLSERRRALRFESEWCFWPLAPRMRGSYAFEYVTRLMREVIAAVGPERVAPRMMWLQYLGYQSREWVPFPVRLASQEFACSLLREAMNARKIVIIGLIRRRWINAVPELEHYDYIPLRNPRNPCFTPGNMGKAEFTSVVEALSE